MKRVNTNLEQGKVGFRTTGSPRTRHVPPGIPALVLLALLVGPLSAQERQAADRGVDWTNATTVEDHNRASPYGLEIHLAIPLDVTAANTLRGMLQSAQPGPGTAIQAFLRDHLGDHDNPATRKALEAIIFPEEDIPPEELRGQDWTNLSLIEDFTGPDRWVFEIHLFIALDRRQFEVVQTWLREARHAAQVSDTTTVARIQHDVQGLLTAILDGQDRLNASTKAAVAAVILRGSSSDQPDED